ncbi:MAG: RNA polymerase sigma factor SigZ [Bacteroidota bacterium]|jgi:RNA polymerase sigma-70 factor (ECF subfamily)
MNKSELIMIITTEKIWKEFYSKLKNFVQLRVSAKDDAEDIVQEFFIRIHNKIDKLKDNQKLESWIYQITRNAIIDYYRRKKEKVEFHDDFKIDENSDSDAMKRLSPIIIKMIDNLPYIYKEAIILTEYKGLKQKELAESLGISLTGAKSRVQRGRKLLKEMLHDCCAFEFDSIGKLSDYSEKSKCCSRFAELRGKY